MNTKKAKLNTVPLIVS